MSGVGSIKRREKVRSVPKLSIATTSSPRSRARMALSRQVRVVSWTGKSNAKTDPTPHRRLLNHRIAVAQDRLRGTLDFEAVAVEPRRQAHVQCSRLLDLNR